MRFTPNVAFFLVLCLAGCRDRSTEAGRAPGFSEVIQPIRSLQVEETTEVVTINPLLSFSPAGSILVTDWAEGQVRLYDPAGRLRASFGKKGDGPKQFRYALTAVPMPDGRVYAFDSFDRIEVLDAGSLSHVATVPTRFSPAYTAIPLDSTRMLVAGRTDVRPKPPGDEAQPMLHVWDVRRNAVVRSFFTPRVPPARRRAAAVAGVTSAALRGDTIAALFAISDTIFFFDRGGRELGKLPVPYAHFRAADATPPRIGTNAFAAAKWAQTFSVATQLVWLANGDFLIQYQDREGPHTRWSLLRMSRDGTRVFEIADTPRLLGSSPAGELYFAKPEPAKANQWTVARFAPSRSSGS